MRIAAILLAGFPASTQSAADSSRGGASNRCAEYLAGHPMACLDILGTSALQRTISRLQAAGVESISVVMNDDLSAFVPQLAARKVETGLVRRAVDFWYAANRKLVEYGQNGVETIVIISLGTYVEFDCTDILQHHRDGGALASRLYDDQGPIDFWILGATGFLQGNRKLKDIAFKKEGTLCRAIPVRGYVNRLQKPSDLRRLVVDAFLSRCAIVPPGTQARPGVWLDEGAQVHRRARVVAPAYIGRGSQVQASALITRFSSLECGCEIDFGTVVEDSTVLADTHLGAGLDVCHAVVWGRMLAHLGHNVTVQIDDERISGNTTGGDWHLDTVAGMVAPQRPMRHKLSALLMGSWRRQLAFLGVNPWPG